MGRPKKYTIDESKIGLTPQQRSESIERFKRQRAEADLLCLSITLKDGRNVYYVDQDGRVNIHHDLYTMYKCENRRNNEDVYKLLLKK